MEALPLAQGGTPIGRAAVLDALKREGPVSAAALASRLGITAVAVRQHLTALEEEGLAKSAQAPIRGRGRPQALWQVTLAAGPLFPDSHQLLATDLLKQMKVAFGDDGLDRLLAARTKDQEAVYRAEMARATTLKARLEALARIRSREGYMAEVRDDGTDYLLVENHCPVCAAARLCQGLCREELELFQRLMGSDATVERSAHLLADGQRCVYRICSLVAEPRISEAGHAAV